MGHSDNQFAVERLISFRWLRRKLRQWLGIAALHSRIREFEEWRKVAVTQEDLERINAATSRIAARVAALLDKIDELGTGNDDEVRAEQKAADLAEASAQLRPLIEQLEGLGADAAQPVPDPEDNQVPVEPGPDVPPVENGGGGGDLPGPADGGDLPAEPSTDETAAGGDTGTVDSGEPTAGGDTGTVDSGETGETSGTRF